MTHRTDLLCPSSPPQAGALVIGVRRPDGTIGYLRDQLTATPEFIERITESGTADRGFRFGAPCMEARCAHWADRQCGLIDRITAVVPHDAVMEELPRCTVRADCRWFAQSGVSACHVCPLVTRSSAASAAEPTQEGTEP